MQSLFDESLEWYWATHGVESSHNARAPSPSYKYGEIQVVAGEKSGITDLDVRQVFSNTSKFTSNICSATNSMIEKKEKKQQQKQQQRDNLRPVASCGFVKPATPDKA